MPKPAVVVDDAALDNMERLLNTPLMPWQREFVKRLLSPECVSITVARPRRVRYHGDPTLGGDGLRIAIDADCPHCGWPERFFDTRTRHFGCIKCTYTSDERNA